MTINDITDDQILELIRLPEAIDACRQAFEGVGRGEISNPARSQRVEVRDGLDYFGLDMPAEWPGHCRSRKIIEEYSDVVAGRLARRDAYLEFEDLQTNRIGPQSGSQAGRQSVRLDAGVITDMRTGAAGALGVSFLASRPLQRVALLGTGRVAQYVALACDVLFELDELCCTSRSAENRQAFFDAIGPRLKAPLTMVPSIEDCVSGADAVLMAVPTPKPIIDAHQLTHVDSIAVIAGDSRTRQVTHEVLVRRPVLVDHYEQACVSGEFLWAREQGREQELALVRNDGGDVMTMADAACGRVPATGGTIYLTGMGAQDLCVARIIHERWVASH